MGTPISSYINKCLYPTLMKPINLFLLHIKYICWSVPKNLYPDVIAVGNP